MDDDEEKFKDLFDEIMPLEQDKVTLKKEKKTTTPERKHTLPFESPQTFEEGMADTVSATDVIFYAKSGLQNKLIKKFKQGKFAIENTLDLHGMTKSMAESAIVNFIAQNRQEHMSCVLIIHGKGAKSIDQKPILKNLTNNILQQHPAVLAISSAKQHHGGVGAVYVLLKSG